MEKDQLSRKLAVILHADGVGSTMLDEGAHLSVAGSEPRRMLCQVRLGVESIRPVV
jgi:hypothetical protein